MPLVVPGITSTGGSGAGDKRGEWMSKLMGKKLSDSGSGDQAVRFSLSYILVDLST